MNWNWFNAPVLFYCQWETFPFHLKWYAKWKDLENVFLWRIIAFSLTKHPPTIFTTHFQGNPHTNQLDGDQAGLCSSPRAWGHTHTLTICKTISHWLRGKHLHTKAPNPGLSPSPHNWATCQKGKMSYFVARSMFFLVTCSFGSECCRLRNSATALAGNSVSQTYPKSLARCTASPAKGDAGGKHTAHQYTWHRGKNPLGKKVLPSTRVLLLKDLDLFLYKKVW